MNIYKEPKIYIDETLIKHVHHYEVFSKTDPMFTDMFKGNVTLMIEGYGPMPFDFPIDASTVEEAFGKFDEAQKTEAIRVDKEQQDVELAGVKKSKKIIEMK